MKDLETRIKNKEETVTVVGLGYVGLQVVKMLTKRDIKTYGVDVDEKKIELLNQGKSPMKEYQEIVDEINKYSKNLKLTTDLHEVINDTDIVIISVPTPINDNTKKPNLTYLTQVVDKIGEYLLTNPSKELMVIIESTVPPGTTRKMKEYLVKKCQKEMDNVMWLHCPERIDPGNKNYPIETIPRVVGGTTDKETKLGYDFYSSLLDAEVYPVDSAEIAEMAKVFENTFRDVNIALVNELAMKCDKNGIDFYSVVKAASTKPFGFMPFYPGPGVGGHCIPKDPYYLLSAFKEENKPKIIEMARKINESMPDYVTEKIKEIVKGNRIDKVLILGAAYKKNTSDTRNSPAIEIYKKLLNNVDTIIYDPYVEKFSNKPEFSKFGLWVLTTDHDEIIKEIKNMKDNILGDIIMYDTRNAVKDISNKFKKYVHI